MRPIRRKHINISVLFAAVLTLMMSCTTSEKYVTVDVLTFKDEDIDIYAARIASLDQARQWGDTKFSGATPVHRLSSQDKKADYYIKSDPIVRHFRYAGSSDGAYIVLGILRSSGASSYAILRNDRFLYNILDAGDICFAYLTVTQEDGVAPYYDTGTINRTRDILVEYK